METNNHRPQILLTNDDGIHSPGLWAAAEALSRLGYVHIIAPKHQYSGAGRSLPADSDGSIETMTMQIGTQEWQVHAVDGSPAQCVLHAMLEILPQRPDLVVSGINYGQNIGSDITSSGTVGAALEGAAWHVPAIAASLEVESHLVTSYSREVDFSTAAYFTALIAERMLLRTMPADVSVLKIEVPCDATPQTPWAVTRQSTHRFYRPFLQRAGNWSDPSRIGYDTGVRPEDVQPGCDVHALHFGRMVSVTPLSLDLTSRIPLQDLDTFLRNE